MFRRSWIMPVALFLSLGCAEPPEPVSRGKTTDNWLEESQNEDPKIRAQAVKKLGNVGSRSSDAINAIIDALDDKDPKVRLVALYAVVRNQPATRSAIPKLKQMSEEDESTDIRKLAQESHQNLSK